MSLRDWARSGWLVAHRASPEEIRDLFALVARDLADSVAEGLSWLRKEHPHLLRFLR